MAKVLIVDDFEFARRSIQSILKRMGYDTITASDGAEATEKIRANKLDLLIIDVVMPKKGGIEALLECQSYLSGVKIIVITGNVSQDSDAFVSLTKSVGVDETLHKPFKKEVLIETVTRLIGKP
ncbi:MAG: response regulator [Spirochaetales bacterium]|nr:response regulator [Spirochaetales bacterium]